MEESKEFLGVEIGKTNNLIRRDLIRKKNCCDEQASDKNSLIIGFIADKGSTPVFQRDIEEAFMLRRSTVSNMIKLMEKKGYITRESVSYDARLKKLVLTEKAKELNRQILDLLKENEQRIKKNISDEELSTFIRVLRKIQRNLGDDPGKQGEVI